MDNDQIDKLLHSYISGTITPQESRQLEAWGDESEENRQILDLIEGHSDLGGELSRMYRYDKEKVWRRVCEEDRRYMRRSRLLRSLRIGAAAAVLAGMLVSSALLYQAGERLDPNRNRLLTTVEPGVRRAVLELSSGEQVLLADSVRTELSERNVRIEINGDEIAYTASEKSGKQAEEAYNPIGDGTRAWLNAGSSITYPLHFGSRRCVTVTGEVFFEVAPDSRHPFVVSVSGVELTVLGTSFNIMAYDDEPSVETTLVTGSLRVVAEGEETLLSPGLQAGFDKSGGGLTVRKADVEACTMWRRGLLVFYDEPLRSICRKLERWYGVEIDTSSPTLDGVLYTGMIKRHATLNTIADLMNLTNDVVFTEDGGVIRVVRKSE